MSEQVQMVRHKRVPHIQYGYSQRPNGDIQIHAECDVCGEHFDWLCARGPTFADWRVAHFANWHTHGVVPMVAFPSMPR